ncbi:MAG: hypothetical protein WAW85_11380 [Gordonia sp. (in: high G+C Gram-positive bacteria)]|uniref:hypothetical protein n=1 Tax=Gordonia sp. (in: high G+C Gram-positive bacteria) TaxID=84139 RepID=UPI003BB589FF
MRSYLRVLFAVFAAAFALALVAGCATENAPARSGVPLPKDFPYAHVPLVDGTILAADGGSPEWQVTVQAPATDGNAFEAAVQKLKAGGYTESSRSETNSERTVLMQKEADGHTYWVTVGIAAAAAGAASTIMYSVTLT